MALIGDAVLASNPTLVFAILAAIAAAVYAMSITPRFSGLFRLAPPVVWLYCLPMLLSSLGLLPSENELYRWLATYILPFSLLLLTLTVDLKAMAKIGRPAIIMLLAGTGSVVLAVAVVFLFTRTFLPSDAWQSLAMLTASWIGGSANMLAMQQSLEADASLLGPVIVTDTVVAYGWLGAAIALSGFQSAFDRYLRADPAILDTVDAELGRTQATRKPARIDDIMIIVGGGLATAILARTLAESLPPLGDPVIISASSWTVLFVVTLGIALSFTRMRRLSDAGAGDIGYCGLYLLLPAIGAQADLRAILEAPQFMAVGLLILLIHIGVLAITARLCRFPSFFLIAGSFANIGGAASAPVASAAYRASLAPVGALMGVAGYLLGIYIPLAVAALLAAMA